MRDGRGAMLLLARRSAIVNTPRQRISRLLINNSTRNIKTSGYDAETHRKTSSDVKEKECRAAWTVGLARGRASLGL